MLLPFDIVRLALPALTGAEVSKMVSMDARFYNIGKKMPTTRYSLLRSVEAHRRRHA